MYDQGEHMVDDMIAERFVVPNNNCSYPLVPGIELPDNYQTPARGSSHYLWTDPGYQTGYSQIVPASTYDQFVSQTIPFAVAISSIEGNQNNAVEIVCITPNNTQPGAPTISDGTPWDEGAGKSVGVSNAISNSKLVLMAGFVSLMLA